MKSVYLIHKVYSNGVSVIDGSAHSSKVKAEQCLNTDLALYQKDDYTVSLDDYPFGIRDNNVSPMYRVEKDTPYHRRYWIQKLAVN